MSPTWIRAVTVTPAADAATYTLGASTVTVAAGAASGSTTLTAVNNRKCGTADCPATKTDKTVSLTATSNDPWVNVGTAPSLTITDDDLLAKPVGVKISVTGTKVQVNWTAVSDAGGYTVQWSTSATFATLTGSATKSGGSTVTHKITTGLSSGTTYYFRVIATKTGYDDSTPSDAVSAAPGGTDYDPDNDGLIDVDSLAKLNAIRWDLDGDGVGDRYDSNGDGDYLDPGDYDHTTSYTGVFTSAEANMGCGESVVTVSSNDTGNPTCSR